MHCINGAGVHCHSVMFRFWTIAEPLFLRKGKSTLIKSLKCLARRHCSKYKWKTCTDIKNSRKSVTKSKILTWNRNGEMKADRCRECMVIIVLYVTPTQTVNSRSPIKNWANAAVVTKSLQSVQWKDSFTMYSPPVHITLPSYLTFTINSKETAKLGKWQQTQMKSQMLNSFHYI